MTIDKQIARRPPVRVETARPDRVRSWDIGDGQRGFTGPIKRVHAVLEVARQRGLTVDITSAVPARIPGNVTVTARLIPRASTRAVPVRRRSTSRTLVAVGLGVGVGLGAIGVVVWAAWSLYEALVANLPLLLGAGAVVAGCSVLLVHRGCRIYVTHIRG